MRAVIRVDSGHGDVGVLGAAAPVLVSAAGAVRAPTRTDVPCRPSLLRAERLVRHAATTLQRAGRVLGLLAAAAKRGKDFSGFQTQFLAAYYTGTDDLQVALGALRRAGLPPLVRATDGKGIFREAGCATCHTLAAVEATGTVGPNLDDVKPSRSTVISAVTNGQGVMLSFKGELTAGQIRALGRFVSRAGA